MTLADRIALCTRQLARAEQDRLIREYGRDYRTYVRRGGPPAEADTIVDDAWAEYELLQQVYAHAANDPDAVGDVSRADIASAIRDEAATLIGNDSSTPSDAEMAFAMPIICGRGP